MKKSDIDEVNSFLLCMPMTSTKVWQKAATNQSIESVILASFCMY